MKMNVGLVPALLLMAAIAAPAMAAKPFKVLQPLSDQPMQVDKGVLRWGGYYVPSTAETTRWGSLYTTGAKPVLSVPSGSVVTFDTVSHEGMLEDQGRDPVKFFAKYGVPANQVLRDAQAIAASSAEHDFVKDGPHIVTGPVEIRGARAGDVLKVEVLAQEPRVPYGVISNRHGKGALPNEFPETAPPAPGADAAHPELYNNVFVFTPIKSIGGKWYASIIDKSGREARIQLKPFNGIMGVAVNATEKANSIPPGEYGGNLDINDLSVGATLYLPIQVDGALFYAADPHFVQGDGEVALTALEGSLRSTFRLTVLKLGDLGLPMKLPMKNPFAETREHWIPIGLNQDLNEAMKDATRQAIQFVSERCGLDRASALAYLSAGADFQVTQVVDRVKGVNGFIRKSDFAGGCGESKSGGR